MHIHQVIPERGDDGTENHDWSEPARRVRRADGLKTVFRSCLYGAELSTRNAHGPQLPD